MTVPDPGGAVSGPSAARAAIRSGRWTGPTAGLAPGYLQANLVVVPRAVAGDFLVFCLRNPGPCPLLDVTGPGSPVPRRAAPGADLRLDLPRYRIWRDGRLAAEVTDLRQVWRGDLVAFLLGCSFSFEAALARAGIELRHQSCGCNVPMYATNRPCVPAGPFRGPLVVSMRPIPAGRVAEVVAITGRYPRSHGRPVHVGDPGRLGIRDLAIPDFGDPVPVRPGETPVFWACGVTPQAVARQAGLPLVITHAPGHMFVTDLTEAWG